MQINRFKTTFKNVEFLPWFGGFFDGEGCIYFKEKRLRKVGNREYYYPDVQILLGQSGSLGKELLDYIGEYWQHPKVKQSQHLSVLSKQEAYMWRISGKKAVDILVAIYPYLVLKSNKADEVITFMQEYNAD